MNHGELQISTYIYTESQRQKQFRGAHEVI